jgi:hypothetical protein
MISKEVFMNDKKISHFVYKNQILNWILDAKSLNIKIQILIFLGWNINFEI